MASPVRIPLSRPSLPPLAEYTALLETVWETRTLSNGGPFAERFETACATYGGWEHSVAMSSCDLALTLAIAALDLPAGTPVILPSLTFASTLHAVLWNRLAPRFVDVDAASFALAPDAVAAELPTDVGLIVATHPFGVACDVDGLERVAGEAGVPLLFDAAHAFATRVGSTHVGTRGTVSAFSFSGTKLVTAGEAGMLATPDAALAARLRRLRAYGRDGRTEESVEIGMNAKLSELHAALGVLTVARVETEVALRAALDARYRERLRAVDGIRLQRVAPGQRPSHTYMAVDFGAHREAVQARLASVAIQTRRYFRPLHGMARFADLPRGPLTVTDRLGGSLLCLPLFSSLEQHDVDEICTEILQAVEAHP